MTISELQKTIEASEFVLVGIGQEFSYTDEQKEKLQKAYQHLAELLKGKTYFILTETEDESIFESELLDFFIAAPMTSPERMQSSEEQWKSYLNWLSGTLGHTLCVLELGVGFQMPQLIRMPFENLAKIHVKSRLIRINQVFPQLPEGLGERGSSVCMNAVDYLSSI